MPEISIIMPVYNTQQYLNQSIRSVLNQSFEDFELICVNDGSTDHSLLYLNALARIDCRIKILDLPHGGVTAARIEGIRAAKGAYIGFVDSDDWVDTDFLLHLYDTIHESHADISMIRYYREGRNGSKECVRFVKSGVYRDENFQNLILDNLFFDEDRRTTYMTFFLVDKLFRKQLIQKNVRYLDKSITLGEDCLLSTACLLDSQCLVISDFVDYHYRARGDSIVHTIHPTFERTMFSTILKEIFHQKGYASFDSKVDTRTIYHVADLIEHGQEELPRLPEKLQELIEAQSENDGCEEWQKAVATVKKYIRDNKQKKG